MTYIIQHYEQASGASGRHSGQEARQRYMLLLISYNGVGVEVGVVVGVVGGGGGGGQGVMVGVEYTGIRETH